MLGYLSADIICSEKHTVFRERSILKRISVLGNVIEKQCDVFSAITTNRPISVFGMKTRSDAFHFVFWLDTPGQRTKDSSATTTMHALNARRLSTS